MVACPGRVVEVHPGLHLGHTGKPEAQRNNNILIIKYL